MTNSISSTQGADDHLVLFDFDGVLFNTNQAKTEAFRLTLQGYPEQLVEQFINYHLLNGGIGRKAKFEYFLTTILKESYEPEKLDGLLLKFKENCGTCVAGAAPLPGMLEFLTSRLPIDTPKGICSGGDKHEISDLLERYSILDAFNNIWGNEESKMSHATERIRPHYERVLFFGDARYDLDVAEAHNFDFVFVRRYTDWPEGAKVVSGLGHKVIVDFTDPKLDAILSEFAF